MESSYDDEIAGGSGTTTDPYLVQFPRGDPRNPTNFPLRQKWIITSIVSISVFAVTMTSSAYSGSSKEIRQAFDMSSNVNPLGVSLFVLGFAVGPCLWAPLSELFGRQLLFQTTYAIFTACVAGSAGADSAATLLTLRFLAGTFGASPLTNAGGVIADLFTPSQRGLGMAIFATAPFLGPVLGPMMAGFVTITINWRWVQGILAIWAGIIWLTGFLWLPETYAPVLLQKRARHLSNETSKAYISILDKYQGPTEMSAIFTKALSRPFALLLAEPIVLMASAYMAILYGTVYMLFGAFPIVFQEQRGWNAGVGGLAFLGIIVGMVAGLAVCLYDNKRHQRMTKENGGTLPPEARLPPAIIGGFALPVGLFGFAWTTFPGIHWSVSIIMATPFGFGTVLVFLSCLNYLVDSYTVYAASVLAAGAILRSLFGSAFPMFTRQMYSNLGVQWASSIPGFLAVGCLPFPLLMYKYGERLRMKCKYAKEAAILSAQLG
ncbi:major facilitator superfamily domain-containing protein [Paraphoma chrysanthemicola]|nr:major facilitator superfamily domain-containing protein [Paraphoma chrysanthemicola]